MHQQDATHFVCERSAARHLTAGFTSIAVPLMSAMLRCPAKVKDILGYSQCIVPATKTAKEKIVSFPRHDCNLHLQILTTLFSTAEHIAILVQVKYISGYSQYIMPATKTAKAKTVCSLCMTSICICRF